jgi:hypothetical protein
MAYALNGTSQYLNTASAPATAAPLTMALWFYANNATDNMFLMSIADNAETGSNRFGLNLQGAVANDPVAAFAQNGATAGNAFASAGFVANKWSHVCGVFASSTSRTVYLDGGNSGTNTTNVTPAGVDRVRIGTRFLSGSPANYFNGSLAEVGIWNTDLTAAEIASLAKGVSCRLIRPQSLVFYAPLIRDLIDVRGGLAITNNNTATVANHPRIYA